MRVVCFHLPFIIVCVYGFLCVGQVYLTGRLNKRNALVHPRLFPRPTSESVLNFTDFHAPDAFVCLSCERGKGTIVDKREGTVERHLQDKKKSLWLWSCVRWQTERGRGYSLHQNTEESVSSRLCAFLCHTCLLLWCLGQHSLYPCTSTPKENLKT